MKPVEIEFLMRDRLSGGLDNARLKANLLDSTLKRVGLTVGAVFTVDKAIEFGKVMMDVRGQIDSFQISFDTLLGSKSKANAFFTEIKDFAVETPLMLDDLSKGAQMMLGFGVDSERVIPILKQIGDITMGDAERFNSMILAFSQMYATGKLQGQDLLQMINAGFNPLLIISERTGKSVAQLKDEMSEGAVSAEMVAQAFADATAEGGKFHGMLEKQSDGVRGMKSNYEGAVDDMLNGLGTKFQDVYVDGLQMATAIVKNYDEVGKALVTCISIYGSYKAAVMAVHVAEKLRYQSALVQMAGMTKMQAVTDILKAKTAALNKTMLVNPYVLVTMAVVGLIAATVAYSKSCTVLEDELGRVNNREKEQADLLNQRKGKIEELISAIQDENRTEAEKLEKLNELKTLMPSVFNQYKTEKELVEQLTDVRRDYNKELREEKTLKGIKNLEDDRKRLSELKRYKELFDKSTDHGYNSLSTDEKAEYAGLTKKYRSEVNSSKGTFQLFTTGLSEMIKAAEGTISQDIEKVRADAQTQWEASVNGMNADAALTMSQSYSNLLKLAKDTGKKWAQIQGEAMPVSTEALEKRIQTLNVRIKTIQENASKDFLNDAKVAWGKAQAEVTSIIAGRNDRIKYPDEAAYKSALEKARQKEESAKKKYENLGGETKTVKGTSAVETANRLKVEKDTRERQIREYTQSLARQERQSEFEIREARISAMDEGVEKEKAAINLHYDKLIEENHRREQQWVKELQDKTQLEFETAHPDYKKKGLTSPVVTVDDLSESQKKQLKDYEDAAILYKKSSEDKLLKELLGKYRSYEQQRAAINKQFDAQRKIVENGIGADGQPLGEDIKNTALTELEKRRKEALKQVNDTEMEEMQKNSTFLIALFEDASNKSVSEINKITASTRELLAYLSTTPSEDITPKFGFTAEQLKTLKSSPKDLKAIQQAVEELYSVGVKKNPFSTLINDLKALFKTGDDKETTTKKLAKIGESASETADLIGNLAGNLSDMFEEMGNTGAADAMSGVQDAMSAISNIGQGFAKGGIVGGIASAVGEAANFIGKAFAAEARHQAALKAVMNEKIAQQRMYNLLLLEQNLAYEKASTIFGVDQYGKAANAVRVMKEAYKQLRKELEGSASQQNAFAYKSTGNAFFDRAFNRNYNVQKDVYSGLADIEVKTGHKKTGLFGWGKGKDIYSSILDVYPQLVDANGKFNASLAETIVSTREMSEEDKAALQNMIDLTRQAEEAWEEVRSYFEGIFGDLGTTLSDALVDAFRNGTDAAENFVDAVTGMLEDLAEQMIYTVTLAPYIERAQDEMLGVMKNDELTDEQKFSNYVRILDNMTDNILNQQGYYNSLLEQYRDMAADKGINLWEKNGVSQSGKIGAYEAASQESITRLEGLYSSMLEHEINIDGNVEEISEGMNTAIGHLKKIEENTSESKKHLENIDKAISEMKSDIATIKRDGVKTR